MVDHPRDPALVNRARAAYLRTVDGADLGSEPDPIVLARLERALFSLPRLTREIFLAHRIDGLSYGEISAVTGLSIKAIERHMVTALGRLVRFANGDERPQWRCWLDRQWSRWFR